MESTLMKRLWFIAILAACATACVEGNNPVQLLSALPRDPKSCDRGDIALTRGTLNFNAGTGYYITFSLFSPLTSEQDQTSPAGFYAEEVVYSYETRNPKVTLTEESQPIYFVVPAGAEPDDSWIELNLIGTEARKKLEASVPAAPESMTLLSTVKIKGKLPSGKKVETNEVTYPIELTRARGCDANFMPVLADPENAPCGYPGQDSFFDTFACVPVQGG